MAGQIHLESYHFRKRRNIPNGFPTGTSPKIIGRFLRHPEVAEAENEPNQT